MTTPVDFPEANDRLLGGPSDRFGTRDNVSDLIIWRGEGKLVSCWRLTWRERLSALVFGRIWLYVLSYTTQPAVALQVRRNIFRKSS